MPKPPVNAAAPAPDDGDPPPLGDVTRLLRRVHDGDESAKNELIELIYHEVRRRARSELRKSSARNGFDATEFGNLTLERLGLLGPGPAAFNNHRHFWKAFSVAMRRILVDYARTMSAAKRGGKPPLTLEKEPTGFGPDPVMTLAVNEALERLRQIDESQFEVLQMQYFLGATIAEIAEKLDVKPRTVDAKLRLARDWLRVELSKGGTRLR